MSQSIMRNFLGRMMLIYNHEGEGIRFRETETWRALGVHSVKRRYREGEGRSYGLEIQRLSLGNRRRGKH